MASVRLALALLLVVSICAPATARADGDPASDFLLTQNVFLPYLANIPTSQVRQLDELVREAWRAGFRIRIALIAAPSDLGSAYALFDRPQQYALFLGQELTFAYRGRLLVVMPNGYGISIGGRAAPGLGRSLTGLAAPGANPINLANGAMRAIQRLAAGAGHPLAQPRARSHGGSAATDRLKLAAIALGCLLVGGAFLFFRRNRS